MITCIIVDDEPLAIQLLENHISKIDSLTLIGTAKSALEAYRILNTRKVDLMFLDVQMPDLDGVNFLKTLHQKPKTIFTTAYREFAVEGFELEASDYILKPITFERFFKSMERIMRSLSNDRENYIILKSEGVQRKIILNEVLYVESQGNDIKIVMHNSTVISAKSKIGDLESILSDKGFIRIHRSFIINSSYVTAFNNNEAILETQSIPVGRSYKKEFDMFINDLLEKRLL
ncbi:LytTR family DNA-binding domain-containing protein [Chryseobacterium sp. Alg-005]|uniref:LytR/AlgR family response regulator transcription factor n=1 Tax=Chryseobacterium sp. Alg-005 TaxID=3159516 RepID=UPI00355588C7